MRGLHPELHETFHAIKCFVNGRNYKTLISVQGSENSARFFKECGQEETITMSYTVGTRTWYFGYQNLQQIHIFSASRYIYSCTRNKNRQKHGLFYMSLNIFHLVFHNGSSVNENKFISKYLSQILPERNTSHKKPELISSESIGWIEKLRMIIRIFTFKCIL